MIQENQGVEVISLIPCPLTNIMPADMQSMVLPWKVWFSQTTLPLVEPKGAAVTHIQKAFMKSAVAVRWLDIQCLWQFARAIASLPSRVSYWW